jgi:hypothetical protein
LVDGDVFSADFEGLVAEFKIKLPRDLHRAYSRLVWRDLVVFQRHCTLDGTFVNEELANLIWVAVGVEAVYLKSRSSCDKLLRWTLSAFVDEAYCRYYCERSYLARMISLRIRKVL